MNTFFPLQMLFLAANGFLLLGFYLYLQKGGERKLCMLYSAILLLFLAILQNVHCPYTMLGDANGIRPIVRSWYWLASDTA